MKEITVILILLTLLTSCGEQRKTAENTALVKPEIAAESNSIGEISCEVTTPCSDMISPIITTVGVGEISPKTTESQTTVMVSENAKEKRSDDSMTIAEIPEIPQKTMELQTTATVNENTEEKEFADSKEMAKTTAEILETQLKTELQTIVMVSENAEEKESVNSETTAVQTEEPFMENFDVPQKTDYEKALEIYNFMRANGSGTCVEYACQTYEMCMESDLDCYLVWTDSGIYGHVANTVKIDDIWYILDAQGGYFLEYNYGFAEVVDIDGSHIADGNILSNYSYYELN